MLVRIGKTLDRRGRVGHHHPLLRRHRRPGPSRSASGYRSCDEFTLDRPAFIRDARAVGRSLGEIRGIAELQALRADLDRLAIRAGASTPPIAILAASATSSDLTGEPG